MREVHFPVRGNDFLSCSHFYFRLFTESYFAPGRLGSQFPERTQESNDIFPAQHADDTVIPGDGQLVDSIAVHLLECGPQPGIRIDAFQLFKESTIWSALLIAHSPRGTSLI